MGDVFGQGKDECEAVFGYVVVVRVGDGSFGAGGAGDRDGEGFAGLDVDAGVAAAGCKEEAEVGELGEDFTGEGGAFAHATDYGVWFETSDESFGVLLCRDGFWIVRDFGEMGFEAFEKWR